jgi:hypothetical protein
MKTGVTKSFTRLKDGGMSPKSGRGWYVKGINRTFYPVLEPAPYISGPHKYKDALRIFDNMRFGVGMTQLQLIKR